MFLCFPVPLVFISLSHPLHLSSDLIKSSVLFPFYLKKSYLRKSMLLQHFCKGGISRVTVCVPGHIHFEGLHGTKSVCILPASGQALALSVPLAPKLVSNHAPALPASPKPPTRGFMIFGSYYGSYLLALCLPTAFSTHMNIRPKGGEQCYWGDLDPLGIPGVPRYDFGYRD